MARICPVQAWSVILLGFGSFSCSAAPSVVRVTPVVEQARPDPGILFDRILEMHRTSQEKARDPNRCRSDGPTRAMVELRHHWTEARLWALSFPRVAEGRCFRLAEDNAANADDRDLAIYVVGILAGLGKAEAVSVLINTLKSDSIQAAATATRCLVNQDPEGRYRELYWERARRGDTSALEVLGDWVDPRSRKVLEGIVRLGEGEVGERAWRSLCRLGWLEAADWETRIRILIGSRVGYDAQHLDWALRVARNRSILGLAELLRTRLREDEEEHRKLMSESMDRLQECRIGSAYEQEFIRGFRLIWVDRHFDEVLRACSEAGGVLTDLEKERLHFLGDGSDPRKRLFEFVHDWN